jgi:hypothetical protein
MEYKDIREKTTQSPKPQYIQISLSHKRELTTKREKLYFFPMPFAATKKEKINMNYNAFKFFSNFSHSACFLL